MFQNQVVVVLTFFVNFLDLRGEFFQVVRARAVGGGGLAQFVLQIADAFFQRADAFVLRGLRVEQILELAVELVNLLLRRGVLPARGANRENEDKQPERNFSHAPKINLCAAASSRDDEIIRIWLSNLKNQITFAFNLFRHTSLVAFH